MKRLNILLILNLFFLPLISVQAQSPDFLNMGETLKENTKYLRYIDVCLSNLSDGPLKTALSEYYKTAIRFDYYAQVRYQRAEYSRSQKEVIDSRKEMVKIFEEVLKHYQWESEVLLDTANPHAVKANDKIAKFYIQKGHRYLKLSYIALLKGQNYQNNLVSDVLFSYYNGIRIARLSKRFAVHGYVESKIPRDEKEEYTTVTLDDISKKDTDFLNETEFEKIHNELQRMIYRKLIAPQIQAKREGKDFTIDLVGVTEDNYAHYQPQKRSMYLDLTLNVTSEGMEEKVKSEKKPGDYYPGERF